MLHGVDLESALQEHGVVTILDSVTAELKRRATKTTGDMKPVLEKTAEDIDRILDNYIAAKRKL